MMNKFIVVIFGIQVILCLCSGLYAAAWLKAHRAALPYLKFLPNPIGGSSNPYSFTEAIQFMGSWVLIFTNFIPISLIVTLEVVKFIQGQTLEGDTVNYPECRVQSSNLNEELG